MNVRVQERTPKGFPKPVGVFGTSGVGFEGFFKGWLKEMAPNSFSVFHEVFCPSVNGFFWTAPIGEYKVNSKVLFKGWPAVTLARKFVRKPTNYRIGLRNAGFYLSLLNCQGKFLPLWTPPKGNGLGCPNAREGSTCFSRRAGPDFGVG